MWHVANSVAHNAAYIHVAHSVLPKLKRDGPLQNQRVTRVCNSSLYCWQASRIPPYTGVRIAIQFFVSMFCSLMLSSSMQVHAWAEACMPPTTEQQKSVIEMYGQYNKNYYMHVCSSKWSQTLPPTPKMNWKAVLHADCDLHRNWVNCFLNLPLSLRVKPHMYCTF